MPRLPLTMPEGGCWSSKKWDYPGGNSGVCAGAMLIPESLEDAIRYYRALSFGTVDEEMIRGFSEAIVGMPRLLTALGAKFSVQRTEPGYFPSLLSGHIQRIQFSPTGAEGFRFLDQLVRARKVDVLMNTAAASLIQDPQTGEVIGAKARDKEKEMTLLARRGVILACGGIRIQSGDAGRLQLARRNGLRFCLGHSRQHGRRD